MDVFWSNCCHSFICLNHRDVCLWSELMIYTSSHLMDLTVNYSHPRFTFWTWVGATSGVTVYYEKKFFLQNLPLGDSQMCRFIVQMKLFFVTYESEMVSRNVSRNYCEMVYIHKSSRQNVGDRQYSRHWQTETYSCHICLLMCKKKD